MKIKIVIIIYTCLFVFSLAANNIISISEINYNSFLKDRNNPVRYEPLNVIDNLNETVWADTFSGEDQYIEITFNKGYPIDSIGIKNGFFIESYYNRNNRIKSAEIIILLENGSTLAVDASFEDSMNETIIPLNRSVLIKEIKIDITDLYEGEKWQDTCISSINFYNRNELYTCQMISRRKLSEKEYFYQDGNLMKIESQSFEGLGAKTYINYVRNQNNEISTVSNYIDEYNDLTLKNYLYESDQLRTIEKIDVINNGEMVNFAGFELREYNDNGLIKLEKIFNSDRSIERKIEYFYRTDMLIKKSLINDRRNSNEEILYFYDSENKLVCIKEVDIRNGKRYILKLISIKYDDYNRRIAEYAYYNHISRLDAKYIYVNELDNELSRETEYY